MQLNLFLYITFYSKYFGCNTRLFFPLQWYTALWLLTIPERQWKFCFTSCKCSFSALIDWELGSKKQCQCQEHQDLPNGQCLHSLSPLQLLFFLSCHLSSCHWLQLRASDHPTKHFREHIVLVDLQSVSRNGHLRTWEGAYLPSQHRLPGMTRSVMEKSHLSAWR